MLQKLIPLFRSRVPSFEAILQTSLLALGRGSPTPTFTRATAASQTDFEGKQNLVPSGCAQFQGARFVFNLIPAAGSGSASLADGANKSMTLTAGTYVFSMGAGAGTATFSGTGGATGTLAADSTSRTTVSKTITAGTLVVTASVATLVDLMVENTTGQANQNPSEYVSVGVLSAPYHGAGVDRVKYCKTLNGNTVTNNVVTEATGAAINSSQAECAGGVTAGVVDANGPIGYLAENACNNYLLQSGTPATQTTASLGAGTYTLWQTGTGSSTSSAGTATITGGGAATAGSPNVFVVTVAGTVTVTVAGTPTTFQLENGAFPSSYIPTTTIAVTRNADVLTYPSAGNVNAAEGTIYAEIVPSNIANATAFVALAISNAGMGSQAIHIEKESLLAYADFYVRNSGDQALLNLGNLTTNVIHKVAAHYKLNDFAATMNGGTVATDSTGTVPAFTIINIGTDALGSTSLNGTIRNVRIYPVALSAAKLQAMTAP